MTEKKAASYRVLERGLEWSANGDDRRAEPGEVVDDLPEGDVKELLKSGLIEGVRPKPKAEKEAK